VEQRTRHRQQRPLDGQVGGLEQARDRRFISIEFVMNAPD
jgi:hypothetical protein